MSGVVGDESVSLQIAGQNIQTWTISTGMSDYTASTSATGELRVAFTNDSGDRDVQVDYVIVNGAVYQAEDQQDNTGAYSGSCGGGSYSEMLHCNGSIGFGNPWNPGGSSSSSSSSSSSGGSTHGFFVGNITTSGNVRSDFMQYWDQITPENEGKWSSVEGTRDVYNWSGVDRAYNYARANGIPFKQHTFVWGNQSPSWINNLSAADQRAEIEEWIRDFCARYPDTEMIDVVNESTPGHAPAGYAQNAYGSNWIIRVFEIARQYCPNSILILNDYNVLRWNTNEFIQMATPAINAGVVDAIGLQAHGLETQSLSELQTNLNRIAALGLPIYISEYDIAQTNDQQQLQIMQQQFPVFYNHPSVVGITLWGYVVGSTWVNGSGLIQSNGNPRPAMTWLMNYLDR
jgi:GH35 family endo-1,4-beta-xylanase